MKNAIWIVVSFPVMLLGIVVGAVAAVFFAGAIGGWIHTVAWLREGDE